ncbi:MAG: diacylglycerol kinase, partial [Ghiorsea sp.]|nr:diacylglycerol kinase [Ghiorsea sp.]
KMMSNLNNHFGDNAEVTAAVNAEVTAYLKRNAAENDKRRYAKSMLGLLKDDETPDYISDTKYFKLMHDAVKPRMVLGNPDVRSFARCEACHSQAQQGKFNRIEAIIPNYFRKAGRFVK